jgi:steroid 5-alpha reductase family enzyme
MRYYAALGMVLFVYVSLWFVVALIKKRNDVADIAWGLGFVLMAWTSMLLADTQTVQSIIVVGLVTLWGTRLAIHIASRNSKKKEDYRYRAWREEWGRWFYLRSYGQVFLLQGALLYVIVLPVLLINASRDPVHSLILISGMAIWLLGFFFEVVGDYQLAQFIKTKEKGQIMETGLWKYTRHPNYFGEVVQWWGIWGIALATPLGWMSTIGPLTITALILWVSGIPMLEKKMMNNPSFVEYAKRTSKFFPLPQKNRK